MAYAVMQYADINKLLFTFKIYASMARVYI